MTGFAQLAADRDTFVDTAKLCLNNTVLSNEALPIVVCTVHYIPACVSIDEGNSHLYC
jgi:hypothetical protein